MTPATQQKRHHLARHEMTGTKTHVAWKSMRARCNRPTHVDYVEYGGRGITVCARWDLLMGGSFENFLEDMGVAPEGLTLERIDNAGNYEPDNCRWASYSTQNRNKRNVPLYEFRGVRLCAAAWAEELGLPYALIRGRLRAGWPTERAFTEARHEESVDKRYRK